LLELEISYKACVYVYDREITFQARAKAIVSVAAGLPMIPYELLEHTADAKFRAYGKTKDAAFGNAILAMTALVVDPQKLATDQSFSVSVKAKNLSGLLFDLLDELLFLLDTEKFLCGKVENLQIAERDGLFYLEASLLGDDARKWPGNLKAVTYSEMIAEEQHGTWVVQAVIDI
jgi:SHS2 domain-containing protein